MPNRVALCGDREKRNEEEDAQRSTSNAERRTANKLMSQSGANSNFVSLSSIRVWFSIEEPHSGFAEHLHQRESQFTHFPSSEIRIGSSSIMNCVLPIAPIMCVPVALYHLFDISSPV